MSASSATGAALTWAPSPAAAYAATPAFLMRVLPRLGEIGPTDRLAGHAASRAPLALPVGPPAVVLAAVLDAAFPPGEAMANRLADGLDAGGAAGPTDSAGATSEPPPPPLRAV